MKERDSLLEILRLLASAGCIDGKIFIRGDDGPVEVEAHVPPSQIVLDGIRLQTSS
jgi:hypothetical protein